MLAHHSADCWGEPPGKRLTVAALLRPNAVIQGRAPDRSWLAEILILTFELGPNLFANKEDGGLRCAQLRALRP